MLIDWFTVGAQIVNFLILVALLKWLLFDRIVRAMDRREETIAGRLKEAERKESDAATLKEDLAEEHRRLEASRQQMLDEARQEADRQRDEWVRRAREEVEQMRRDWRQDVKHQQEQFLRQLSQEAGEALRRAVGQALADVADTQVEQAAAHVFLHKLAGDQEGKLESLAEAAKASGGKMVVTSAAELPEELQRKVVEAIERRLGQEIAPTFETSPELIAGLEVRAKGHALSWTLRQYLDEFDEAMSAAVRDELQSGQPSEES